MNPAILILVRRGENPAQCTIRRLRGTPGLDFLAYPLRRTPDLTKHLLLAPDAPPLSPVDVGHPLLLLDASWRHAAAMRRAIGTIASRSVPAGWQTAYPRCSKIHTDPPAGLATVEALYAALCTLGFRDDSLLRFYPWRDAFMDLNHARIPLSDAGLIRHWPCGLNPGRYGATARNGRFGANMDKHSDVGLSWNTASKNGPISHMCKTASIR